MRREPWLVVESGELLQWAWQAAEGAGKRMRSKMSGTIGKKGASAANRLVLESCPIFVDQAERQPAD